MSSNVSKSITQRRTSQRRRLKMLRNLDEYKISNPYKSYKELLTVPEELCQQLKRLDYLSSTTIDMLSLEKEANKDFKMDLNLLKMAEAIRSQQDKFRYLLEQKQSFVIENPQMVDCDSISEDLQKDQYIGEQVCNTNEQISLNLNEIHHSFFDCREVQDDDFNLLSSIIQQNGHRGTGFKETDIIIMDDEYQNYFAN